MRREETIIPLRLCENAHVCNLNSSDFNETKRLRFMKNLGWGQCRDLVRPAQAFQIFSALPSLQQLILRKFILRLWDVCDVIAWMLQWGLGRGGTPLMEVVEHHSSPPTHHCILNICMAITPHGSCNSINKISWGQKWLLGGRGEPRKPVAIQVCFYSLAHQLIYIAGIRGRQEQQVWGVGRLSLDCVTSKEPGGLIRGTPSDHPPQLFSLFPPQLCSFSWLFPPVLPFFPHTFFP